MIVGIDASNIRQGGGVTHLVELLHAADPQSFGFSRVVLWSGARVLGLIEDRGWLVKIDHPSFERSLLHRAFWQRFRLSRAARAAQCNVLFVVGGSFAGRFRPVVTMSRNMLPFDWREVKRFGYSWLTLKLILLRLIQTRTFERADGLIFLTRNSRDIVWRAMRTRPRSIAIVPHGIDPRFLRAPRVQLPLGQYSAGHPFRILYVSIVHMYKHQWNVAEAVAELRRTGMPVTLTLTGPAYPPALDRLQRTLDRVDPEREFIRYSGEVPHDVLPEHYAEHDLVLLASTCEAMPNILLEGMASGLPVACSNRGPMPEMLGDSGIYFDPESAADIARALRELVEYPELRARVSTASRARAQAYSWRRCSDETFRFLAGIAAGGCELGKKTSA
ncbi:MAG: glycosyltransferase family 4 protein [Gemmatimonadaceae bacterium]|nr:glycosyltransferase family 4 protein [Gemmatimonadaceae bacterium]